MKTWQVQEAKARFSELLRASTEEGPQLGSSHVVVPVAQWLRLQQHRQPSLKEFLLTPEPRFELETPARGKWLDRTPPAFED